MAILLRLWKSPGWRAVVAGLRHSLFRTERNGPFRNAGFVVVGCRASYPAGAARSRAVPRIRRTGWRPSEPDVRGHAVGKCCRRLPKAGLDGPSDGFRSGQAGTIGDDPVAHAAARMPDATGRCHPLAEPPKGRGKRPFAHRDPAHPVVRIMPGRAGIRHRLDLRAHHTSYRTRCGHAHEGRGTQFPRWRTWDTEGTGPSANTPDADDAAFSCRRAAPSRRRQRFRRRPGNPRLGPPADSAIDPRTVPRTASCR